MPAPPHNGAFPAHPGGTSCRLCQCIPIPALQGQLFQILTQRVALPVRKCPPDVFCLFHKAASFRSHPLFSLFITVPYFHGTSKHPFFLFLLYKMSPLPQEHLAYLFLRFCYASACFARVFFPCFFLLSVLQSLSVNGMQCEGELPDITIRTVRFLRCMNRTQKTFITMTKTRLRGSPCSGLRGSQEGSTVPCPYSVQIRAVSILSEGLVQACCGMPFFILQDFSRR